MIIKTKSHLFKLISLVTLSSFLANNAAWGMVNAGVTMVPQLERPSFLQVEIPSDLASIEDVYQAPAKEDPKLILHVQNIHGNYESQVQISKLLQYLYQQYGFKLIFAEGAADKLNPDYMRFFPDAERNKKLADLMARDGALTGVEYYLMDGPKDVEAVGIEEAELYRQNYAAFKKIYSRQAETQKFLDLFEARLETLASRIFSPNTRRVLSEWKKFESGHRDFLPFVKRLAGDAKMVLNLDLESLFAQIEWPQITRLLALQSMEKELDHKAAEKDKKRLLEFLKEQKIDKKIIHAIETLDEKKISMVRADERARKEDLPRFLFERLVDEASPKGFQFHDYPAFSLWAGHLILQNELDSTLLFEEIETVFSKVLTQLTVTEREKNLMELTRDEMLLKKLLKLEVTRKEWDRVVYRKDWMVLSALVGRLQKISDEISADLQLNADDWTQLTQMAGTVSAPGSLSEVLETSYRFYDLARKRESVFYDIMQKTMAEKGEQKAVLVTGGFHTDGLMDIFRDHEINASVLMPRVVGDLDNSGYVSTMLENKPSLFEFKTQTIEMIAQALPAEKQFEQGAGMETVLGMPIRYVLKVDGDAFTQEAITNAAEVVANEKGLQLVSIEKKDRMYEITVEKKDRKNDRKYEIAAPDALDDNEPVAVAVPALARSENRMGMVREALIGEISRRLSSPDPQFVGLPVKFYYNDSLVGAPSEINFSPQFGRSVAEGVGSQLPLEGRYSLYEFVRPSETNSKVFIRILEVKDAGADEAKASSQVKRSETRGLWVEAATSGILKLKNGKEYSEFPRALDSLLRPMAQAIVKKSDGALIIPKGYKEFFDSFFEDSQPILKLIADDYEIRKDLRVYRILETFVEGVNTNLVGVIGDEIRIPITEDVYRRSSRGWADAYKDEQGNPINLNDLKVIAAKVTFQNGNELNYSGGTYGLDSGLIGSLPYGIGDLLTLLTVRSETRASQADIEKGIGYHKGEIATAPVKSRFRPSMKKDFEGRVIPEMTAEQKLHYISIALASLSRGEGVFSTAAAGAAARMNMKELQKPENSQKYSDLLKMAQEIFGPEHDILSKAAVPIGRDKDGTPYTFLGLMLTNIAKLQDQISINIPGAKPNRVMIMTNADYQEELQLELNARGHYGLDPKTLLTHDGKTGFQQDLGAKYYATPQDAGAVFDKLIKDAQSKNDAGLVQKLTAQKAEAIAKAEEISKRIKDGDKAAVIYPGEKDPLGHGEFAHQMVSKGVLLDIIGDDFDNPLTRWISFRNIDNAAATFDDDWLVSLGLFLEEGLDMQPEVSLRIKGQKGGGLVVTEEGNHQLTEDPSFAATFRAVLKELESKGFTRVGVDAKGKLTPEFKQSLRDKVSSGQSIQFEPTRMMFEAENIDSSEALDALLGQDDDRVMAYKDQDGNEHYFRIVTSADTFGFNDAVAIFSPFYILDFYRKPGQSRREVFEEMKAARAAGKLEEIAERGRSEFPYLVDPKQAKSNSAEVTVKIETNFWQGTGVVGPDAKIRAVGVYGLGNIDTKEFASASEEEKLQVMGGVRMLATKSWEGPAESYESNKPYIDPLIKLVTENVLFPVEAAIKIRSEAREKESDGGVAVLEAPASNDFSVVTNANGSVTIQNEGVLINVTPNGYTSFSAKRDLDVVAALLNRPQYESHLNNLRDVLSELNVDASIKSSLQALINRLNVKDEAVPLVSTSLVVGKEFLDKFPEYEQKLNEAGGEGFVVTAVAGGVSAEGVSAERLGMFAGVFAAGHSRPNTEEISKKLQGTILQPSNEKAAVLAVFNLKDLTLEVLYKAVERVSEMLVVYPNAYVTVVVVDEKLQQGSRASVPKEIKDKLDAIEKKFSDDIAMRIDEVFTHPANLNSKIQTVRHLLEVSTGGVDPSELYGALDLAYVQDRVSVARSDKDNTLGLVINPTEFQHAAELAEGALFTALQKALKLKKDLEFLKQAFGFQMLDNNAVLSGLTDKLNEALAAVRIATSA